MQNIHLEIRTIDILQKTCEITIHERFAVSIDADKKGILANLLSGGAGALFYLPIFLMDGMGLTLIARQWVWAEYMSRGLYNFKVIVVSDESLLPEIIQADDSEIKSLTDGVTMNNSKRNTTRNREKCRATGRICPVCGGVLRRPRSIKDRVINGEQHMIGCENNVKDKTSKHHGTKCNFVMSLTDAEIIKFNNYELNINEILEKSDDVCKKCSSKLYKRTITKFSGVSVKMRCRNAYKSENPCTYSKEII